MHIIVEGLKGFKMDVNSINNGIGNLTSLPQNNLDKTNQSHASHEIVKDDALNVTITQSYQKARDELSQNLQSLNEGVAFTAIAKNALDKQSQSLENMQQELYKIDANTQNDATDIKNGLAGYIQEFNDIAESTTFKNEQILLKDQKTENMNIVTPKDDFVMEQTNTKDISTKLIQSIHTNNFNTKEDVTKALKDVQTSIGEVAKLQEKYGELEKNIGNSARETITDQINLSKENSKARVIDFGSEVSDFNKSNITSNVGHLIASQANIVQEQSVRLLSK